MMIIKHLSYARPDTSKAGSYSNVLIQLKQATGMRSYRNALAVLHVRTRHVVIERLKEKDGGQLQI